MKRVRIKLVPILALHGSYKRIPGGSHMNMYEKELPRCLPCFGLRREKYEPEE
jgi:hypothetical protein